MRRDDYTCSYCGCDDRRTLSVDHVIPRSRGGADDMSNLAAACTPCNLKKSSRGPERFFRENPPVRAWIRALAERLTLAAGPDDGAPAEGESPLVRVPEMEARALAAANEVRAGPGPFVCPIFEEACPLKRKRRERAASDWPGGVR
jgi:hypothetical protein